MATIDTDIQKASFRRWLDKNTKRVEHPQGVRMASAASNPLLSTETVVYLELLSRIWGMHLADVYRKSTAPVLRAILLLVFTSISGCASITGYETERFATGEVRITHSGQPCSDDQRLEDTRHPDADHLRSDVIGLGYFVATKRAWEVRARQLATELDADIAVIRLCNRVERGFKFAQLEVWRTRGYIPVVDDPLPLPGITLAAPPGSTHGSRLQDIFECLEESHGDLPSSAEEKARLAGVDATRFFSNRRHFPGYAQIDRHFRPTSNASLALSMIVSHRLRADHEARVYQTYSSDSRSLHAEKYLVCLLDRRYRL